MKKLLWVIVPLLVLGMACTENEGTGTGSKGGTLQNKVDSMSYAVGLDMVAQIKQGLGGAFEFTFNEGAYQKGAEDALAGKDMFSDTTHFVLGEKMQALVRGIQMARQADPTYNPEFVSKKDFSLDTNSDSISYSLGAGSGKNLIEIFVDENADKFNVQAFLEGSVDAFAGKEKFSKETTDPLMKDFEGVYREVMQSFQMKKAAINQAEGEAFLAENAQKEGVKTTASGLQYKIIKQGTGKSPTATDKVKVHYEGTLLNGEIFDSSIKRGEPISFSLNGVIKGWTEGVQLMNTGSKFTFFIPGDLAYGLQGYPPAIPPGATLVFDIELLGIE